MIGSDIFHTVNSRLQQITGNDDKPFGGQNIIFCGDLRQLPPIKGTPIYKRYGKRINGEMLWQRLYYYPLIQIMRQSNIQLSMILTKIGNGESLNLEETMAIEKRFIDEDAARQLKPSAIRLFLRNDDVSRYNASVLKKNRDTVTFTAIDRYEGYRSNEQLLSMQTKVQKMKLNETSGLPCELSLLIGAPYMITSNIDVVDGLVNGAIGNLMYIEYDENDPDRSIKHLWFDFGKGKVGQLQKAKWETYIRSHKSLQDNWVAVRKRTIDITFSSKALTCRRQQFPLLEAYALTIHKSQGATFDEIVYEYSKSHVQELVYVALSRVTSLQELYLTNKNKHYTFYHTRGNVNNALSSEFRRLENHRLPTVTDECEKFLERTRANDLTHTTLNVQSLKSHKYDVAQDFLLKTTKMMALSETWMDNNEIIDLEGYHCINQFKRENVRPGGVALYEMNDSELMARKHTLVKVDAKIDSRVLAVEQCGDICAAEACINRRQVLIVVFYISPGTSLQDTKDFFEVNLLAYNIRAAQLFESLQLCGYDKLPIIISGDLNLNLQTPEGRDFIDFMECSLNLKLVNDSSKCTTLGGTTVDAVFTRYMDNVHCRNYVNYFSYHQPILCTTNESFNSHDKNFK
ncbi:uncharacterized protein LOC143305523 [Osmia lignaria lignaria]|uniref:uncharacterized protein LOC143305523 n=1 Tax=Osmia lignaria lignaria TaxID=1437193 RepID=UPI00402B6CC7